MPIPQSFLDELIERSDIVDVVSEYVELKQKGTNLFGLCPFHSEKTPSFSVNRDKQIFHCFGCGEGGGVITFIMKAENLGFVDAVKHLAARVGMTVPEDGDADTSKRRAQVLALNKEAARRFHANLYAPGGRRGLEYFYSRGLTDRTIRRFGLGWAPDSWDDLLGGIKGYEKSLFLEAGLAVANRKGGLYDRFRGRVMFPIIDLRGEVIGFGGRVLDDSQPKYLNSPETIAFSKSRNLFAMNLAKKSTYPEMILAEGYMDVISLHQAGFSSAVASLGTALTDAQARLISRYKQEAVIAYDMDAAGRGAAERAIKLLEDAGIKVKLIDMAGAKDPDEFIKRFGADALSARLTQSEGHVEYRLGTLRGKYDLSNDEGRINFLHEAAVMLAELSSPAERAVYSSRVAELAGVRAEAIADEVAIARKKKAGKERSAERRRELNPVAAMQPKEREVRYSDTKSARAEEGLIRCMYSDGELLRKARETLPPEHFSSETLAKAYSAMLEAADEGRQPSPAIFEGRLTPAELSLVMKVLMDPEPGGEAAFLSYIEVVRAGYEQRQEPDGLVERWQKLKKTKGWEDKEDGE